MADALGLGSEPTHHETPIPANNAGRVDPSRRETQHLGAALGQSEGQDPIEIALAGALTKAAAAGKYELVGQLARELEARRVAREEASTLPTSKAKRA